MDILVIFIVWGLLLALGIPVGFTLIIAALMYFLTGEWNLTIASGGQLISGINNFTLLAIPFFIMTGNLMNSSGITDRIFNFASSLVGQDRKSTRLNSSHVAISYAVFCLKK